MEHRSIEASNCCSCILPLFKSLIAHSHPPPALLHPPNRHPETTIIHKLSAKFRSWNKDRGDYVSLIYLRSSEKMTKGNMGSPSWLKNLPKGPSKKITINLLLEPQKDPKKKENNTERKGFPKSMKI